MNTLEGAYADLMIFIEEHPEIRAHKEIGELCRGLLRAAYENTLSIEAENKRYKEALENVKTITENSGWGLPSQEKTITIINSALNGGKGNE